MPSPSFTGVNPQTGERKRDDRGHHIGDQHERRAHRIAVPKVERKGAAEPFTPAESRTHPLKMPPTMPPAQVDWKAGREYYDRVRGKVRLVSESDVPAIVAWAIERFQERYPRCAPQGVIPFLKMATRGGRFRFVQTDNAAGLFVVEQTPWEPEPVVYDIFVVAREPQFGAVDVKRIYSAGRAWAEEINAVEFKFGSSTGWDLTPIARRIGYDYREYGFSKRLR